jgi:AcrR family transcriptional regulator
MSGHSQPTDRPARPGDPGRPADHDRSADRDRPVEHARQTNGNANADAAILAATEQLLAEVPLRKLSVAQIIVAAGISRATFYFYFPSKFAVLAELVRRAINEIYAVSRPTLHSATAEAREVALTRRIEDSARVWDAHRPVLQATVDNLHAYPELQALWLEMLGGLTDAIATEIEQERAAGRAPDGPDARGLAAMLAWTTERCLYGIGLGLPGALSDRDGMLAVLVQIWMAVMYGPAPGPRAE